ncbi:MAG: hypothetical protein H0W66_05110 [Chthoniobacterales bacterium]|nr:hypothetical protein [Chthoniobacterales bacterium]
MKSTILWRRLGFFALLFASGSLARAEHSPQWVQPYNGLLGKYVTSSGVKYAAWKNSPRRHASPAASGRRDRPGKIAGLSKKKQLAFYINAYNA